MSRFGLLGMIVCSLLTFSSPNGFATGEKLEVSSPDGKIAVRMQLVPDLNYSVKYEGRTVVNPSKLGLEFLWEKPFGKFAVKSSVVSSSEKRWEYPWGRQKEYLDKYNELKLDLEEIENPKRPFTVLCRVYDDGIAFRYLVDEKAFGRGNYVLDKELTEFHFPGDPVAWFADFGSFRSSQEKVAPKGNLSGINPGAFVGCPIVLQSRDQGPYIALTEAELNHCGGLYFESAGVSGAKTAFDSGIVRRGQSAKSFEISLKDVHRLVLSCDDAGDGNSFDHADWVDLVLLDKNGNKKNLTELKPLSISEGWGQTRINKSCEGNPLSIAGKKYEIGFGTHARGEIVFALDQQYVSLSGAVGIDDEVGNPGTVRFKIATTPKAENVLLKARIATRRDQKGVAKGNGSFLGPWRLIIIAPKAIDLVDQTILMNVSAPSDPNFDWSWIQPGIGSWDWWSKSNVDMDTEMIKHFISFAAEMGWEYTFVDDPWYAGTKYRMGDPRNNILKGNEKVDMEEVVRFAKEKNVKLFLWLHWKDFDRQMDEALALYEKWGIAGLKIDFMDCDDQEIVQWYDLVVQKAAKRKMLVDFHGAYKPTGYRRAFPNLITREGIYGNEQNKWSKIPPEFYCVLPYTRLMLGPGDFTPGAFLNRHYDGPGSTIPGAQSAQGIGTRAHELAISLLYDSPILCLCDRPEIYRGQPGLEFYRGLPTVWDESRGVEGEIGEYFSMIRRKGKTWYYGAITNGEARTLKLSLEFLGSGDYEATVYADTSETETDARKIAVEKKTVNSKQTLEIKMVRTGGQTIVFTPK